MTAPRATLAFLLTALFSAAALAAPPPAKAGPPPAAGAAAAPKPAPIAGKELEATLYALGGELGARIDVFALTEQELQQVLKGLRDRVAGKPLAVKLEEQMPKVQQLAGERHKVRAAAEKKKGEEYLAKMSAEAGYTKLDSGLLFKETKAGEGPNPTAADTVSVHYRGTLVSGDEFDSSHKRGVPAEFPLGNVVKCWKEGVGKMKVGGKAMLVCPSELAYGEMGRPGIPPNAVLTFEVELLGIKGKDAPEGHGPNDGHAH